MKTDRHPPVFATWLIEHFTDPYRRDALVGDLIEEYRGGRSGGWYWGQCAVAVLASGRRSLSRRLPTLSGLLVWWSVLGLLAFTRRESVLLLAALDPSLWLLIQPRRRRRRGGAR
jgi:hypothetical protein